MSAAVPSPEGSHPIRLTVNGQVEETRVSPRRTLLQTLREDLHLTGTKEGCGVGTCGACTVLVDGKAMLSCLMLSVQAAERTIDTVEGLTRNGELDRLQQTFIRHDAFQCGFCTPGQIMALHGLFRRIPHPTRDEILQALAGNVCRCGAYLQIQAAALAAAGGTDPTGT